MNNAIVVRGAKVTARVHRGELVLRVICAFGPLLACGFDAVALHVFELFQPLNRAVLQVLMPEFSVTSFILQSTGTHLLVFTELTNIHYLVADGGIIAPGLLFSSSTPAREGLLLMGLTICGTALLLGGHGRALAISLSISAGTVALLEMLSVPVVLAGSIWDLDPSKAATPSFEALTVWAARFMLHGGGYVLVAVGVLACRNPALRTAPA